MNPHNAVLACRRARTDLDTLSNHFGPGQGCLEPPQQHVFTGRHLRRKLHACPPGIGLTHFKQWVSAWQEQK